MKKLILLFSVLVLYFHFSECAIVNLYLPYADSGCNVCSNYTGRSCSSSSYGTGTAWSNGQRSFTMPTEFIPEGSKVTQIALRWQGTMCATNIQLAMYWNNVQIGETQSHPGYGGCGCGSFYCDSGSIPWVFSGLYPSGVPFYNYGAGAIHLLQVSWLSGGGCTNAVLMDITYESFCTSGCLNGGTCVWVSGGGQCQCPTNYYGPTCATQCISSTCSGHGYCAADGSCSCDAGWNGQYCNQAICSPSCAQGTCVAPNTCSCNQNYYGSTCATQCIAATTCSGHGSCHLSTGACVCDAGWIGQYCSTPTCDPVCVSGQGTCSAPDTCDCGTNYYGSTCSVFCESATTCSGRGTCSASGCSCNVAGWGGPNCNTPTCNPACVSGQGSCIAPNTCNCNNNYYGPSCATPCTSATTCNGKGSCDVNTGACVCIAGWGGADCNTPTCNPACVSGQGSCTAPNTCTCAQNYYGSTCATHCTPATTCSGHGYCDTATGVCICDEDWTGSDCSQESCENCLQGSCDGSNCNCFTNWYGPTCNTYCSRAETCLNHGDCLGDGTCDCDDGWNGQYCNQATCNPPCVSGQGSCTAPNTCSCGLNYYGPTCAIECIASTTCSGHGYCLGDGTCSCHSGWSGQDCSAAVCNPLCVSGQGSCTAPNTCTCAQNYYGPTCATPCNPATTCTGKGTCDTGTGTCSCDDGWSGSDCNTPVCSPPCVSGQGNCVAPNDCSCNEQYYGSTCSIFCSGAVSCNGHGYCSSSGQCICDAGYGPQLGLPTDCANPICTPSCQNGLCVSPNTCQCNTNFYGTYCSVFCSPSLTCRGYGVCLTNGSCNCTDPHWTGNSCEIPVCNPSCVHGSCTAPDTCSCSPEYTGPTCTIPVCSQGCFNGNCTAPNTCDCQEGWSESNCNTAICTTVSCQHGGICSAPETCDCGTTGYGGDECEIALCDPICQHGGFCPEPGVCNCTGTGYNGTSCQDPVCDGTNICVNGYCLSPGICNCTGTGYGGRNCGTPICEPECVNGNCTLPQICTCGQGWEGSICEIAICSQGCVHGDCLSPDNCTCQAGWEGVACDQAICTQGCFHGSCNLPNNCTCDPLFAGIDCNTPICLPPCQNNGTCWAPETFLRQCNCTEEFVGQLCDISASLLGQTVTNSPNLLLPILLASLVFVVVAIIVIVVLIWTRRRRKFLLKDLENLELNPLELESTLYAKLPGANAAASSAVLDSLRTSLTSGERDWTIQLSELKFDRELGRGAYGIVYRGTWRTQDVAIKKILGIEISPEQLEIFTQEVQLMKKMRPHKNVMTLVGVIISPPCIVTPFYENGSLFTLLGSDAKLSTKTALRIIKGIAHGMAHLVAEGIVHRDLAARNILLNENFEAIVCDFGMSRVLVDTSSYGKTRSETGPLKWMPPESLTSQQYSEKSDVWSFAVTCWEIFARQEPFADLDPLSAAFQVNSGLRLEPPSHTPPEIRQMMFSCWNTLPKDRPTFDQLCQFLDTYVEGYLAKNDD